MRRIDFDSFDFAQNLKEMSVFDLFNLIDSKNSSLRFRTEN